MLSGTAKKLGQFLNNKNMFASFKVHNRLVYMGHGVQGISELVWFSGFKADSHTPQRSAQH